MDNKKVTIVDSCCGTGKTSWAIQKMIREEESKFIYITPFLDEIQRVIKSCANRYFYQPDIKFGKGSKREDFKNLLREQKNIASTHALFKQIDRETIDLIKDNDYILILDEVMDVVEPLSITKDDKEDLERRTIVDDKGKLHWIKDEYDGGLNKYYNAITNGEVYKHRNTFFMWTFPSFVFDKFKETYIMTYMFNGQFQRYYYDMNNIKYTYKSVNMIDGEYELVEYQDIDKSEYRKLLNICNNERLNSIGKGKANNNPLSASWYKKNVKGDKLDVLKKNLLNYFTAICDTKSSECGWTVYKDYQKYCKGKGYTKGFMSLNIRSTNQYRNKTALAYCVNLYMNPLVKSFFTDRGINVAEDEWALSELIQFIFRGCIRDKKEMNIYVPSERMRKLLIGWLEN